MPFPLAPAWKLNQDSPRIDDREIGCLAGHQRARELACQSPPRIQGRCRGSNQPPVRQSHQGHRGCCQTKRAEAHQELAGPQSSRDLLRYVASLLHPLALLTLVAPDTYTPEELVRCSQWCLAAASGPRGTHIGARDRVMLLFSTSTAFRGESARILQWSDLFVSEIPMDDISSGFRVPVGVCTVWHHVACAADAAAPPPPPPPPPQVFLCLSDCVFQVLAALADNAKHNKDGRVDEHGALCHRNVDLCPVGAIAMMFFSCKVPFCAARGMERNEHFGRPLSRCSRPPLFTVPLDLRSPLPPFPSVPSLSSYPLLDSCYDLLTA
jgi:hypothetical protein